MVDTRLSSMEMRHWIPLHTYVLHGSRQVRGLGGAALIRACQDGAFWHWYVDHSLITHLNACITIKLSGYKLRTHINKSLKTRCKAVQHALSNYNSAAKTIGRPPLDWSTVSHYGSLA